MLGLSNYLTHVTPAPVVVFGVELVEDAEERSAHRWLRGRIADGALRGWHIRATSDELRYVAVQSPSDAIIVHTHGTSYAACEAEIASRLINRAIAEAALLPELARRVAVDVEAAQ
jgi:hypothetical protein